MQERSYGLNWRACSSPLKPAFRTIPLATPPTLDRGFDALRKDRTKFSARLMSLSHANGPAQVTARVEGYDGISMTLERVPQQLPVEIQLHPFNLRRNFGQKLLMRLDGAKVVAAGRYADILE